jgi:tRNA dimethylallyltransferase
VLVGGTGLYLDALIRGTDFAAGSQGTEIRQELQRRARNEGIETLLEELRRIDPIAAEKLHLRDEKRIIRALEVWQETGRTITEHDRLERQQPPKYDALYIGLDFIDRQDLRDRIDRRVDIMVEQGLLAEVKALLDSGLPRDATALQAIGYKQFLAAADGRCTVTEAIEEVKLRSRQYAKRQLTWFRRREGTQWITWEKEPDFGTARRRSTEFIREAGLG